MGSLNVGRTSFAHLNIKRAATIFRNHGAKVRFAIGIDGDDVTKGAPAHGLAQIIEIYRHAHVSQPIVAP